MCEQLTLLAQNSDYRQVYICEHNMIHLTWDTSTVYLPEAEFEQLVKLVNRGLSLDHSRLGEGRYQMILTPTGYYQLWMANAGLMLSADDALIFVDLIGTALRELQSQASKPSAGPDPKYDSGVIAPPNNQFWVN